MCTKYCYMFYNKIWWGARWHCDFVNLCMLNIVIFVLNTFSTIAACLFLLSCMHTLLQIEKRNDIIYETIPLLFAGLQSSILDCFMRPVNVQLVYLCVFVGVLVCICVQHSKSTIFCIYVSQEWKTSDKHTNTNAHTTACIVSYWVLYSEHQRKRKRSRWKYSC